MSIRYRPEIDGLRAVAVGSVLIYHLDLYVAGQKILQGGYLGVDIFFVISGFLIASLIRKEYTETGQFSILDFYERRARRLLPALFVVIVAASIAAPAILVPTSLQKFSESVLASIGFVSNIYWLFKSQIYGAHSGLVEPMLHTWSLAVEEQFYIVFPLVYILVLSRVRRGLAWLGFGAIVAGFILAVVLTRTDFTFSFYMLFSRIWELLCGAVLAHALAVRPEIGRGLPFARALPALGLAMIAVSLLVVPLHWNHHPGFGTIGAVLGTVLVIWFADPKDIVTRFLSWRVMLGIGLISYSLYLWHYPIYAFGRLLSLMDPGPVDYAIWLALSFATATLSYAFVERPFRSRQTMPRARLVATLGVTALAIAGLSSFVIARQGLPERLAWMTPYYGTINPDNEALRAQSWDILDALAFQNGLEEAEAHEPTSFEADHLWFDLSDPAHKVLIVGNSHSKDLFNALHLERARFPEFQFARFGALGVIRPDQIDTLLTAPNFQHADTILLSFRYNAKSISTLPTLIEPVLAAGKQVVITSNTTEFEATDVYTLVDVHLRRDRTLDADALSQTAWTARTVSANTRQNRLLRALADEYGLPYLEKEDYICDTAAQTCPLLTPAGAKVHSDYGHYTLKGAAYYGQQIAELNWLGPLLDPNS